MGPLRGIRVLELSTGIAGPLAGMLLADYGADVVKVEPPAGDPARSLPGFAMWNRGKKSLVLDRASPAGASRVAELMAEADVCISADFPTGHSERRAKNPSPVSAGDPSLDAQGDSGANNRSPVRVGDSSLDAQNDGGAAEGDRGPAQRDSGGCVYVHMPPYAPAGTPWAGGAESGELLAASGGPARRQSSFDGGPIDLVYPFPLYVQGVWGAACAVAALVERERSGLGQVVTVAGIHGVLASSAGSFVIDPGQPPLPTGVGPGGRHPTYTTYKCGDGAWLFLAALTPKFQANAFQVLGVGDSFSDPRIGGEPGKMLLPDNREWIRGLLLEAFARKSRDEWLRLLEEGDCPTGPTGERDAWLDHPQILANGLRVTMHDPEHGPVVMPGLPLSFSKTAGSVERPAPCLGQHNGLADVWDSPPCHSERRVKNPSPARAGDSSLHAQDDRGAGDASPDRVGRGPLAGYRVLDLGTILAGPYAGALLAELGADVIKVESPAGDAFRETGFVYNRGMRGLAMDLSAPAAQRAFHALAQTVDVVLDNSRQGVAARLGVDYESLAEHKPDIVTMSIAGFGERGPLAHKPAFDPVLQAMSGMMTAQGGDSDPVLFAIPVNDVAAAVTSVLGVCLGLFHRERTGEGQRVSTSLAAMSLLMQSGEIVRVAGRQPSLRGGRDFVGASATRRFYATSDGWVWVEAGDASELLRALGRGDPLPSPFSEGEGTTTAEGIMASLSTAEALDRLQAVGIPAVVARHPLEVVQDAASVALELTGRQVMPDGRPYIAPRRYARFSRTESDATFEAPGVGQHSREVLAEAGLSATEIDELIAARAVFQGEALKLKGIVNYR